MTTERLSTETALQRISDMCAALSERMAAIEVQLEENRRQQNGQHQEFLSLTTEISQEMSERVQGLQTQIDLLNSKSNTKHSKTNPELKETEETISSGKMEHHKEVQMQSLNQTPQLAPEYWEGRSSKIAPTTIMIPPSSEIPTFSGKHSERPKKFLIQVQEYAETVHGWDQEALLERISRFLRASALDWYCQLRISYSRPTSWVQFVDLFLTQFNSPIRNALQRQEWHDCKQEENETINEFVVRLRAIWSEQKPKETEVDLAKHLVCKMRNDLLSMLGGSRNATLDEIMAEARNAEEIIFRRSKNQRRNQPEPRHHCKNEVPSNFNEFNTTSQSPQYHRGFNQKWNTTKCYNCGRQGHKAEECRKPNSNQYSTSKNEHGALHDRGSNARTTWTPKH